MIRSTRVALLLAAALPLAFASAASATVLTFDVDGVSAGQVIPQAYGDNVDGTPQPGFSYGAAGGLTPNVTVDYAGQTQANLNFWTTGYGDLVNVIENENDGDAFYTVTLTAAAGFTVTLNSFDMGNWSSEITSFPGVYVKDGNGNNLFSQTNFVLPGSASNSHLTFTPGVTASTLVIYIDTTGLGGSSDNIGLDNINFSQSDAPDPRIPEPASLSLLALGGLTLLARRRK